MPRGRRRAKGEEHVRAPRGLQASLCVFSGADIFLSDEEERSSQQGVGLLAQGVFINRAFQSKGGSTRERTFLLGRCLDEIKSEMHILLALDTII